MNNQETLSPLSELGQIIYERACEAREKAAIHHENKNYHGAVAYTRVASALVELGNEVSRMQAKAEKASVEKPSPGGSLQRVGSGTEAAATKQSGAGGWRDEVTCPYCGYECEDSRDMGCPDVNWTEETECPQCEKTFEWTRLTTTQYLSLPVAGEGESGNDSEPGHSATDKLSDSRPNNQ